ncbi:protein TSSC4 isoform X2 [Serinus canaria]|uniref:protein TSSC4 isoform X2 n=1 Tax=Serinus canaria TaxID=9135 RepID=UPI0021CC5950|nr:protein TSSC4 isoform X2 [Serinus canaria]
MCSWWPSPAFPTRTKAVTWERGFFRLRLRKAAAVPCLPLTAPGSSGAAPRLLGLHGRAPHRALSTARHRLRNVGAAVRPGSCSPAAQHRFAPLPGSQNVLRRGKAAAYNSQEPQERWSCQEAPALSAPLSPPGVVVLPPLWPLRGAWQGLGVPALRGPWAEGQRWERRARRAAAVEGGSRKAHRVCLSNTGMEEPTGSLPIRRDVILPESCCGHVTITNLVEVLRSLVALTDPQEGKLTQSQEKALSSLGIWESVFRVVPGPTSKTSVE